MVVDMIYVFLLAIVMTLTFSQEHELTVYTTVEHSHHINGRDVSDPVFLDAVYTELPVVADEIITE